MPVGPDRASSCFPGWSRNLSRQITSIVCLIACTALLWGIWQISSTVDPAAPLPDLQLWPFGRARQAKQAPNAVPAQRSSGNGVGQPLPDGRGSMNKGAQSLPEGRGSKSQTTGTGKQSAAL